MSLSEEGGRKVVQENEKDCIEARMVMPLLDWFAENARKLMFRENPQPYYCLLYTSPSPRDCS